jgi:beta-glucanase (GH16 family)
MKRILLALLAALATRVPVRADSGWELVWSDEFNYTGLPDPSKWGYEHGFLRNHEKQYYTRGRLENARVEGGMLVIEGRRDDFRTPSGGLAQYTSASLFSKNPADWLYGRIEVKAKLPEGKGVWPAIWMLGSNITKVGWPACGEIDIMEFVGKEPDKIYSTLHYRAGGVHKANHKEFETPRPSGDFHVYAAEWFPDRIDFFFEGEKYQTVLTDEAGLGADNPFRRPQKLLINLALGGAWGGDVDDSMLPQKYLIDYVRIYKSTGPN